MSDIVNARVESLIRTAGQLVDVMKREIELLRSMRAGE